MDRCSEPEELVDGGVHVGVRGSAPALGSPSTARFCSEPRPWTRRPQVVTDNGSCQRDGVFTRTMPGSAPSPTDSALRPQAQTARFEHYQATSAAELLYVHPWDAPSQVRPSAAIAAVSS